MSGIDCAIQPFSALKPGDAADALVGVWNRAAREAHGYFPLSAASFRSRILESKRFRPELLLAATHAGAVVGFAHADSVAELHYPLGGVVEALVVDPAHRRQGIGSALLSAALRKLENEDVPLIDGGGAWPFSPFYATLIDGSERSGPDQQDAATLRLLESAGFRRERESRVMRLDLNESPVAKRRFPPGFETCMRNRPPHETWLDTVFRDWRLVDHLLTTPRRTLASRAIFARMDGLSDYTGRETYALFGVNTPGAMRRQGFARENLLALLEEVRRRGGELVELHVYADNIPALHLYMSLGFRVVGETVAMRRGESA